MRGDNISSASKKALLLKVDCGVCQCCVLAPGCPTAAASTAPVHPEEVLYHENVEQRRKRKEKKKQYMKNIDKAAVHATEEN